MILNFFILINMEEEKPLPQDDAHDKLLKKKQILETEKLETELKFLRKPYLNPIYWAPLIGTTLALFWAMSTGWFTNQNDALKNQNMLLENRKLCLTNEISNFEMRKQLLQDSLHKIQNEKLAMIDSTGKLNYQISILQTTMDKLNKANFALTNRILSDKRLIEIKSSIIKNNERELQSKNILTGFVVNLQNIALPGVKIKLNGESKEVFSDHHGYFLYELEHGTADEWRKKNRINLILPFLSTYKAENVSQMNDILDNAFTITKNSYELLHIDGTLNANEPLILVLMHSNS